MQKVHMPSFALYQPDIPQNLGAFIRLSACLGMKLHVIEPCGFPLDDRKIKRAAMDYGAVAEIIRHVGWDEFARKQRGQQTEPALSCAPCERQNVA